MIYVCIYIYIYMYHIDTMCIYIYIYIHTYIHTYIHIHIHIYIHIYVYIYISYIHTPEAGRPRPRALGRAERVRETPNGGLLQEWSREWGFCAMPFSKTWQIVAIALDHLAGNLAIWREQGAELSYGDPVLRQSPSIPDLCTGHSLLHCEPLLASLASRIAQKAPRKRVPCRKLVPRIPT